MKIAILITNPNHHFELTHEVALLLKQAGHSVKYVSLCEMRRMASPEDKFRSNDLDYIKFGNLPKNLKPSSGKQALGKSDSLIRKTVQYLFWRIKLKPFVRANLKEVDKVLLMNDAAFPGDRICQWLKQHEIPFFLLQEGIRFPLPNESESKYGGNGAEKIFAWGERSAKHFEGLTQPQTQTIVTGSPRFDKFLGELDNLSQQNKGFKVLGVFTNPIDDQGFCTKNEKLDIFEKFIQRSSPYLVENNIKLSIKCHPREDETEYLSIANKYMKRVDLLPKDILKAISQVDAGVVMASTVGLELLGAGKGLAQLEIPKWGYVFDYTDYEYLVKIPVEGEMEFEELFSINLNSPYFKEHVLPNGSAKRIFKEVIE